MASGLLSAILCGSAVGFSLGLIGGGGSILALPLLIYVVGVSDPHIAIGTSALAVSFNAFVNLLGHWRSGNVNWRCAAIFAAAGVVGAAGGSSLGKIVDGDKLLFLFALVMVAVAIAMVRPRAGGGEPVTQLTSRMVRDLIAIGFGAGALSGFFGIGGGFLIVPGLMLASGMTLLNAVGSSLFAVGAFGLTAALNYALSGLVAWTLAGEFIVGGVAGGAVGLSLAGLLGRRRRALNYVFAGIVLAVACYMIARSIGIAE
jgi:uncharacterized membrane protein YfcA